MYKAKVIKEFPEVIELDSKAKAQLTHIDEHREKKQLFVIQQHKANLIMSSPNSSQSDIDAAKVTYHHATKLISQYTHELQIMNDNYSDQHRYRSVLHRDLTNREAQKQYEAETIPDLTEKNKQLAKTIAELLKKTEAPLLRLDELRGKLIELNTQRDILIEAKEVLTDAEAALDDGKLEARLSNDKKGLDDLRKCVDEGKKSLANAEKDLSNETEYQKLRERLFERAGKFKAILEGIEIETKALKIEHNVNGSLIEQIRYISILDDLKQCCKKMVACDDMTDGQSTMGRDLINHLTTKGLTKPTALGPCKSNAIFDGLLDNLDEEKVRIQSEFNDDLEDSTL